MQKLKKSIFITLLAVAVLFVFKSVILKTLISFGASQTIGVRVSVKSLTWEIFDNRVTIKGLKIHNPKNFPREPMMNTAFLEVNYKFSEIFSKSPHVASMVMDVSEIIIVKNKDRLININQLNVTDAKGKDKSIAASFPVQIDVLKLNVGQVIYKDYSEEDTPVIKTYDAGLKDKEFKNIKSPKKLLALVLFKALGRTSIKGVKIYALAAFLGPAFLPVGVTGVLVSKDHADGEFDTETNKAYAAALTVLKDIGEVKEEDEAQGLIKAEVSGHNISVTIEKISDSSVKITASARKLKVPKPEFAGGILYQISKEL